jgi:hypothetical protein
MMAGDLNQYSPAFYESARLMVDLHRAMSTGDPDGPEADAIRDRMDQPWYQMTCDEQDLVRGLSQDLYTIGMDRTITGQLAIDVEAELREALSGRTPKVVLELLRKKESYLLPDQVAALRGVCWDRLGCQEAAATFFEEAVRLAPEHPLYLALQSSPT